MQLRPSLARAAIGLVAALAGPIAAAPALAHDGDASAVFTTSNAPDGNAVLAFRADGDALAPVGSYPTGGTGTGAGLGSQGALATDGRYLVTANAGSDDVSLFAVRGTRLRLLDRQPSGGDRPISVDVEDGLVYVVNAGGAGSIDGFRIAGGHLVELPGAQQPLSTGASGPAQVEIAPDARHVVVTEKATSAIDVYPLDADGAAGPATVVPSAGATPFGFAFGRRGTLVVSEAAGGAPGASTVSSYRIDGDGLRVITPAAPTDQTAACWIAVARNGRLAYSSNPGSDSITGFRVRRDGALVRLSADGVTATTPAGSHVLDLAADGGSRRLYALLDGAHAIGVYRIARDGSLAARPVQGTLPAGAAGIAAT